LRNVIVDNHFQIHDVTLLAPRHVLYINEEFILRRDGSGLLTEMDGILYRVLEVTHGNAQPVDGILPTLTPEGEFVWAFGLVTADSRWEEMEITVTLENTGTGENHSRMVSLRRIAAPWQPGYPTIATREVNGILVLENRNLNPRSEEQITDFLHSGYALRDRPIFIMDLRGNSGGSTSLARWWVGIYTGQKPTDTPLFAISSQSSQVAIELQDFFIPYDISVALREAMADCTEDYCCMQEFIPTGLSVSSGNPRQMPIPNESFLIVLIDNNVGSAGDMLVGYLRQLKNVLFVGTNTHGSLVTGFLGRTNLPYSGLDIMFGTGLRVRPDLSQIEGVGFKPDLWVPPGESLERVLHFIERYGLARQ